MGTRGGLTMCVGGSALMAIDVLTSKGVPEERILFLNLIASPEGAANFAKKYPKVRIVTAFVDRGLNEKKCVCGGDGLIPIAMWRRTLTFVLQLYRPRLGRLWRQILHLVALRVHTASTRNIRKRDHLIIDHVLSRSTAFQSIFISLVAMLNEAVLYVCCTVSRVHATPSYFVLR